MVLRRIVLGCVLALLVIGITACGGGARSEAEPLDYRADADELVIFADENTSPGGFMIGQECNHIPRLRIWGDGRTIFTEMVEGVRQVRVGQMPAETIDAILAKLDEMDYFENPPENTMNPNGTGYRLSVHLVSDSHESFWSELNNLYPAVFEPIDSTALSNFVPEKGYLVIGPRLKQDAFQDAPEWPAEFSKRLSDPATSGREVSGEELDFLWNAVNRQPEPLTGIRDGDGIYAVALFIEGISMAEPPFRCWNK